MWWKLRDLKQLGYHFRRQAPFRAYTLDFVEHDAKLVVELDGGQHGEDEHRVHDERRDRLLESQGYRTLRFWNTDVIENIEGVFEAIIRELEHRPPPDPLRGSTSPQGGR
jgi:crossover junction endodeoxyribonuclease RuvC